MTMCMTTTRWALAIFMISILPLRLRGLHDEVQLHDMRDPLKLVLRARLHAVLTTRCFAIVFAAF
jgi:hypothetical protein